MSSVRGLVTAVAPVRDARRCVVTACVAVSSAVLLMACACGSALAAGPAWRIDALANSSVAPGGQLQFNVPATNVGGANTDGSEYDVTAALPAGMTAVSATLTGVPVGPVGECTAGDGSSPVAGAASVRCASTSTVLDPAEGSGGNFATLQLVVAVDPAASGTLTSSFQVSGGGAEAAASTVLAVLVTGAAPAFGVAAFDGLVSSDVAGDLSRQAGGHPYAVTTSIDFNTETNPNPAIGALWPVAATKDVVVGLPPGFVGDPTGIARCTVSELSNSVGPSARELCPPDSQIGTAMVRLNNLLNDEQFGPITLSSSLFGPVPVFNMVAPPDVPARFAFNVAGSVVTLDASVRTGSDYGVTVTVRDASEGVPVNGTTLTLWDVPSDPSHDGERACPGVEAPWHSGLTCASGAPARAFLRNPTSCQDEATGSLWSAAIDSWAAPGAFDANGEPQAGDPRWQRSQFRTHQAPGYPYPPAERGAAEGPTGCEKTPFTPSLSVQPTSATAGGPTGLDVTLSVPQEGITDPGTISQADVKKVVLTLPEGMTVNPSQASGLQACTLAQIGLSSASDPTCPDASKLGTVEVQTPLLEAPLTGNAYLAAQNENPFGTLLALYIVAKGSGTLVKLPARIDLDPATGRLTATVDNAPQLPFSRFELRLDGGSKAPLINPTACGPQAIGEQLTGWNGASVTVAGAEDVSCPAGQGGFSPSFVAGTLSNAAGSFSPFAFSLSRNDSEQRLAGLSFTFPPGVSAVLNGVPRCSDADANAGTCPEASRIGGVTVGSGAGPDPFFLKGSVYLTGPYNGGAFGDAVVVPVIAGPFHLGNVVVRGSIRIDPYTAQPTSVSDPLPQFVGGTGISTDIRRVDVTLDRPGFTFNPTSCAELHATGTLTSAQGASVDVSSRFQAAECRSLAFGPSFRVFSSSKHSRLNGASLRVAVRSGAGQANIAKVDVRLPTIFAVRDSTLNQACTEAQFARNPAGCPAGSFVGEATARTPLLASALSGPAILVSHGNAKFPDLDIVLQGEGVTVILVGASFVTKGHLFSRFDTVPDAPVSRFDLSLPQGPHSVLAANGSLCAHALRMPTTITGQNGAVLHRSTRVSVSGCGKRPKRHKHHK